MSNLTVADTIFDQLGGRGFAIMTGAKNFIGRDDGLSFKLPRGTKNKATHVRVTLDASDTYTVEFLACRAGNIKDKGTFEMIYADKLVALFETETGLYTTL